MSSSVCPRQEAEELSIWGAALRDERVPVEAEEVARLEVAGREISIRTGRDSLWLVVSADGRAKVLLRAAFTPSTPPRIVEQLASETSVELLLAAPLGRYRVRIEAAAPRARVLRARCWLTPDVETTIPFYPRDLYVVNAEGDPTAACGRVLAAQRGPCTGLVFATFDEPPFGTLLYVQNFTTLNDYYRLTGTTPDGRVGGKWPELGYALPTSETNALPPAREVALTDAYLTWDDTIPADEHEIASLFIDRLAAIYRCFERPDTLYHDWPARAEETLRDLQRSPDATLRDNGKLYVHPYLGAEYPDSMVQLTVLQPLTEYAHWRGCKIGFADELREGIDAFFDEELGTLRRYLPSVGADKDPDEVDSWYMFHPLSNLGRLALAGDKGARETFLKALEYGIKVAQHFEYRWPVLFNIKTFDVVRRERGPGQPGQSDAGGLFSYTALQAWDLTQDDRYLEEAQNAIRALAGLGFDLEYQSNLCAWGAQAALRLWKITGDEWFRGQSHLLIANFFHNNILWESRIGTAADYQVFMGATCLHDGEYMAMYECFESLKAFTEYLALADGDIPEPVELLLTEYIRYTQSRAWFYYPMELPEGDVAREVRNGHIDRALAIPVEDLYPLGKLAGQVGQEIYGCGSAFVFASSSYHRLENAPFLLFSECPLRSLGEEADKVTVSVRGVRDFSYRLRLLPLGSALIPDIRAISGKRRLPVAVTAEGHREIWLSGQADLTLEWANRSAPAEH